MSYTDEIMIQSLLNESEFYIAHVEENDYNEKLAKSSIDQADSLLKRNIRESFNKFSADTIIRFCEVALTIPDKEEIAEYYIDNFFQRN